MLRKSISIQSTLKLIAREKRRIPSNPTNISVSDKVAAFVIYVLANENIFKPYLIELNNEIAKLVKKQPFYAPPQSHVILYHDYKFPAPPKELLAEADLLQTAVETVLLKQEQKHGVNIGRTIQTIALFSGPVPTKEADELVAGGSLFNDDNAIISGWVHGKRSHRYQHYCVTRFIEDNPEIFKSILGDLSPNNIFKHLLYHLSGKVIFKVPNEEPRAHWHFALDNRKDVNVIVTDQPHITGPVDLMEYMMSPASFAECPYLANVEYHCTYKPIFIAAETTNRSVAEILNFAKDITYQIEPPQDIINFCNQRAAKLNENPNFRFIDHKKQVGILWQKAPSPEVAVRTGFFNSSKSNLTASKAQLYKLYKVQPTENEGSDLEKILKLAAKSGRLNDLKILVNELGVTIDNSVLSEIDSKMQQYQNEPNKLVIFEKCKAFLQESIKTNIRLI